MDKKQQPTETYRSAAEFERAIFPKAYAKKAKERRQVTPDCEGTGVVAEVVAHAREYLLQSTEVTPGR